MSMPLKVTKHQMKILIRLLTVTKIMNTECYTQKEINKILHKIHCPVTISFSIGCILYFAHL